MDHQESVNRATFASAEVWPHYERGWSDLGERRLFSHLAERVRDRPVLDLGVGSGRTTEQFLKRVSTTYVGIDLSPTGVELARGRFPDVDLRVGDARDLSDFADGFFGLVHFSYNGIDLVSHEDRGRVLAEMVRVCAPDGLVSFSTFNLDSFYARAKPWLLDAEGHRLRWHPAGVLPWVRTLPEHAPRHLRTWRNWWRVRGGAVRGEDWAVAPLQIHDFGLLAHFVNRRGLRHELAEHGLVAERVLATTGDELDLGEDHGEEPYRHVVARRAAAAPADS